MNAQLRSLHLNICLEQNSGANLLQPLANFGIFRGFKSRKIDKKDQISRLRLMLDDEEPRIPDM